MKEYGLALWWGAARWVIHVGVLKYLEENNIAIKEVSWTSMWAVVASFIAIWKNSKEITKIAKNINYLMMWDMNLREWLLDWKKVEKKLKEFFWDKKIEETEIPLKIVATDIETYETKIFTSWKIVDAIRASLSLPWIFAPKQIDWKNYVDGWIMMNLPIEALDWDNIIASSALKLDKWKIIQKRKFLWINFKAWFFKNNYQIINRSIIAMMSINEERSMQVKDKNIVLIRPYFWKLDIIDFDKVDDFVELGYNESIKVFNNK